MNSSARKSVALGLENDSNLSNWYHAMVSYHSARANDKKNNNKTIGKEGGTNQREAKRPMKINTRNGNKRQGNKAETERRERGARDRKSTSAITMHVVLYRIPSLLFPPRGQLPGALPSAVSSLAKSGHRCLF